MTDRAKAFQEAIESLGFTVTNLGVCKIYKPDIPEGYFLCWDCLERAE